MAVNKPVQISFVGTTDKFRVKKKQQRSKLIEVLEETADLDEVIIAAKPKFTQSTAVDS